jgi:hypothetical protein
MRLRLFETIFQQRICIIRAIVPKAVHSRSGLPFGLLGQPRDQPGAVLWRERGQQGKHGLDIDANCTGFRSA